MDQYPFKPDIALALSLLREATSENRESLLTLAELYRAFVKGWAHANLPKNLRKRVQSSSVAQETMFRLQQLPINGFECRTLAEFEKYLLCTSRSVVADFCRFHLAKKRSIARESSLEELESHAFWQSFKTAAEADPAEIASANDEHANRSARVRHTLVSLPSHYRGIIRAYFQKEQTIEQIAARLGRNKNATRMLLDRAIKALKQNMGM